MTQLSTLIESEIADFFAGFGGPGEPDIQSGEAQRLLTDRINGMLAAKAQEPVTIFKPVADLYEMQFDDGRTCAFHTDPAKAVQWLATCDGNKVQQYVKLERYQQAITDGPLPYAVADVARAALDYIDALPSDVVATLPMMPGFDRDWAEDVLNRVTQQPAAVPDGKPSFGAMMRALDAFYADNDVPENAMLAAFKILVADVRAQAAQQQEVNFTETVGGQ